MGHLCCDSKAALPRSGDTGLTLLMNMTSSETFSLSELWNAVCYYVMNDL